jgi:hypothetical protein
VLEVTRPRSAIFTLSTSKFAGRREAGTKT